ncbi:MAG: SH3 domain-containing protein [Thermoanaerobaculia bacterium]
MWLVVNIVVPIALLNSALLLTLAAVFVKRARPVLAWASFAGGCYLLADILGGWLADDFVRNVVKDRNWITVFVLLNSVALGVSAWLLIRSVWSRGQALRSSPETESKRRGAQQLAACGAGVAAAVAVLPALYFSLPNSLGDLSAAAAQAAPSPATLVVATDQARIRAAPRLDARVISSLMSGAEVEDLGSQGEWKHIRLRQENGQIEGWMHGSLFSPKGAEKEDGGVPLEAVAREQRTDEKFAIATVSRNDTPVLARITTGEVRLSANVVTPPGNAIGQPSFVIRAGEAVDVVAIFANDGETSLTCKVRSKAREMGFLPCGRLGVLEWIGERGALLEIVAGQPFEYEGDWAAVEKDIAKLSAFVEKHPKSRFAAYAELKILGLRLYIGQAEGAQGEGARTAALSDLSYLKSHGTLRHSGTRIEVRWPAEARESGWFDQGAARLTPGQSSDLFRLVRGLTESVPSPISNPTDESASPPTAAAKEGKTPRSDLVVSNAAGDTRAVAATEWPRNAETTRKESSGVDTEAGVEANSGRQGSLDESAAGADTRLGRVDGLSTNNSPQAQGHESGSPSPSARANSGASDGVAKRRLVTCPARGAAAVVTTSVPSSTSGVKVLKTADTAMASLGVLENGTEVESLGETENLRCKVRTPLGVGWVSMWHINPR